MTTPTTDDMKTNWQPIKTAPRDGTHVDLWLHIYASSRSMGWEDSFRVINAYWKDGEDGPGWYHLHEGKEKQLFEDYVTHWTVRT